jgi:hypothetical protein
MKRKGATHHGLPLEHGRDSFSASVPCESSLLLNWVNQKLPCNFSILWAVLLVILRRQCMTPSDCYLIAAVSASIDTWVWSRSSRRMRRVECCIV